MAASAVLTASEVHELKKAPGLEGVMPAIHERWSARSFDERTVSEATLKKVFEAARWAASLSNEQPCRFVVGRFGDGTLVHADKTLAGSKESWTHGPTVLIVGTTATK